MLLTVNSFVPAVVTSGVTPEAAVTPAFPAVIETTCTFLSVVVIVSTRVFFPASTNFRTSGFEVVQTISVSFGSTSKEAEIVAI